MRFSLTVFVLFLLISPIPVLAKVFISEIMYDLDGSDSKREWVEIFNSGNDAVSLSGWRFYENSSNHKLTLIQGDESIASGGYAVITNNAEKFLLDWPKFSGTIFDSSFSLSNSGEQLIVRDSELMDIDSVIYSSEQGANGDGNSLYYTGVKWSSGNPTPGSGSLIVSTNSTSQKTNQVDNSPSPNKGSNSFVEKKIFAQIINSDKYDRVVTVGADSLFKGRAVGLSGDVISGARYAWSFGDGGRKEGKSILYHYRYPGKYIVVLDVSSGEYSATDRILVSALPAQVLVTNVTKNKIEILNQSNLEIDFSWWVLKVGDNSFTIPKNTIVLPKQSVTFSSEVTKLSPEKISDVLFLYPNGVPVSFKREQQETKQEIPKEGLSIQTTKDQISRRSIVGRKLPIVSINRGVTKEISKKEGSSQIEKQLASVSNGVDTREKDTPIFWFALMGIILFGSFSAIILRRKSREEIKIIE